MYNPQQAPKTSISLNKAYQGETIEKKIRRIVNNKEPITDGAPLIYTERKNGVQAEYNIKTDKWEVALDAMDKIAKAHTAKREERMGEIAKKNMATEAPKTPPVTGEQQS